MRIGIDLGGTNTAAALVDESGAIIKRADIPTDVSGGADGVINGLLRVCEILLENTKVLPRSIGLGVPGLIDNETGDVIFIPNLPLDGANLADALREKYGLPVHLGNDANCAVLGEFVAGSAKGTHNSILITLGTGLGGGVILNDKLYTGSNGAAGELGHMVIVYDGRECGCGRHGCWERYASATGLIITATEFIQSYRDSLLWDLCEDQIANLNGKLIFEAFRAGDTTAKLIVGQYAGHLAAGLVNLVNIFQPDVISVGGGISNAWDCLEGQVQSLVNAEICTRFLTQSQQTRIARASLGNDAGIIGAAMLGKD